MNLKQAACRRKGRLLHRVAGPCGIRAPQKKRDCSRTWQREKCRQRETVHAERRGATNGRPAAAAAVAHLRLCVDEALGVVLRPLAGGVVHRLFEVHGRLGSGCTVGGWVRGWGEGYRGGEVGDVGWGEGVGVEEGGKGAA